VKVKMKKYPTAPAMRVQLSRLFSANSRIANVSERTDADWRRDLRLVLAELHRYLIANIDTDIIHLHMLESGFLAAYAGLDADNFWPSYVEGITRIMLCLMGNYPDHRDRKSGSKSTDHYKLDKDRAPIFIQNAEQRLHMLLWSASGLAELKKPPFEALHEFRAEVGFHPPVTDFLAWYKRHYPIDYGKVF
jgi:hypothetical protein